MRPIFHPGRHRRGIARVFRCHTGRRLRACITVVTFGAATGGVLSDADAQMHGPGICNLCTSPICIGESMDCTAAVWNADGYGDSIEIEGAWDIVFAAAGEIRVPESGSLPIMAVVGNTTCTVGGELPCRLCSANSLACGIADPLVRAIPGLAVFRQDTYVVQPRDPALVSDQMTITWKDVCDGPTTIGCAILSNDHQWACGTETPHCDDGDECTVDSCRAGLCEHAMIAGCGDGDPCDADGLCESGENCSTCRQDCVGTGPGCGNGVCEPTLGESCLKCPEDCNGRLDGKARDRFCCGAPGGKAPGACNDARCGSSGFACSMVAVEDACCGDYLCEGLENGCNCALDCGPSPDEERGTSCADGFDNDCDGLADVNDPDCLCGRRGVPCASSADCCSNNCSQRGVCR